MRFKQDSAIFPLNYKPLKLSDLFTYLDDNISSTESDVCILIEKGCTAIKNLSTFSWKSDKSDQIRWERFLAVPMEYYTMAALLGL